MLNQGNKEALGSAEQLINTVGAAMNYDVTKSSIILKNAADEVFSRVTSENGWINQYLDISDFKKLDLDGALDWQSASKKVLNLIKSFQEFLHRFIIWGKGSNAVKSACLHILFNVEDDISVKNVAEKLFISKAHLSEVFKQSTGTSLLEYITSVKVERAKYLLRTSPFKNYEIAEKLGFSDHEYFSKIFKKHTGFPPAVFRKEIQ
jgi:two-component system response regulator YesN